MQKDIINSLTKDFEAHAQQTDNGIEYWLARDLQHLLGYTEWRNFEGVIKRAMGIIRHKHLNGTIEQTARHAKIGSGASRELVDYKLDKKATQLLQELCSSYIAVPEGIRYTSIQESLRDQGLGQLTCTSSE